MVDGELMIDDDLLNEVHEFQFEILIGILNCMNFNYNL